MHPGQRSGGEVGGVEHGQEAVAGVAALHQGENPTVIPRVAPGREHGLAGVMPGAEAELVAGSAAHVEAYHAIRHPVADVAAREVAHAVLGKGRAWVDHRQFVGAGVDNFLSQGIGAQIDDVAAHLARIRGVARLAAGDGGEGGIGPQEVVRRVVADEIRDEYAVALVGVQGVPHPRRRRLEQQRVAARLVLYQDEVAELRLPGQAVGEGTQARQHAERRELHGVQHEQQVALRRQEVVKVGHSRGVHGTLGLHFTVAAHHLPADGHAAEPVVVRHDMPVAGTRVGLGVRFQPPQFQAARQRERPQRLQGVGVHLVEGFRHAFVHCQQAAVPDQGRHAGLGFVGRPEVGERAARQRRCPGGVKPFAGGFLLQVFLRAHEAVAVTHPAIGEVEALDHAVAVEKAALAVPGALEQPGTVAKQPALETRRKGSFNARCVVTLGGQRACQSRLPALLGCERLAGAESAGRALRCDGSKADAAGADHGGGAQCGDQGSAGEFHCRLSS